MNEPKDALPAAQPGPLVMPDDEVLYELADLFRVFGDSTRIKILYALHDNELCVQDIANAVQLNDPSYNGDMLKYVSALRASGTYENDSALAQYYYLPRQSWDDLFACSLEGIRQVRSSPDGWNYQMDFYRTEVLPAMGADNVSAFVDGVAALGDALDAMNAEGRLETVELNETNQSFLRLCRSVKEQELSEQDAYTVLTLAVMSSDEDAQ